MQITAAARVQASEIGGIFGRAFSGDPVWAVYYPDTAGIDRRIADYYRRQVWWSPQWTDVVTDVDATVLGALLWEPPADRKDAADRFRERMVGITGRFLDGTAGSTRGREHDRLVESYRPADRHWYLHDVATDAAARGRGVGTALLEFRLDAVDRTDPAPVFLESTTPASRRLYSRMGFTLLAELDTVPGSSVMLRPPAQPPTIPQ